MRGVSAGDSIYDGPMATTTVTHEVTNQPPSLWPLNLFTTNRPLVEALGREGGAWAHDRAVAVGEAWGSDGIEWGFQVEEHRPTLTTHDRFGHRIDEVEFHPSWHRLMALSREQELHSLPWTAKESGHVARTALYLTATQAEFGFACPTTMTFAAVPALRAQPELAAQWESLILSTAYDGALRPAAAKGSAVCGMAMTEKQGGSDVRSNTTTATPLNGGGAGAEYVLRGHKWFCSAPMSDLFLVLAQTPEGIGCFLVPRILEDGSRNVFRLQRLKDKLGNRSNASSEVEFDGTVGRLVGEPGRGVATIIEMVGHTRLDRVLGSTSGMRWAVANALHHASHRSAFGKRLADQPLMTNVLADLALESEAATALSMRLARAYDEAHQGDEDAQRFKRLATAVAKFHVCKRFPMLAAEALECLGGNGYVEASFMPRIYREAPLNSVWEGSGNVNALDVLRALSKEPEVLHTFLDELALAGGADARYDAFVLKLREEFADTAQVEVRARRIVERMALALQGSLLVRHAPPAVADAFCASRLAGDGGGVFGTLPPSVDARAIVARNLPVAA